MILSVEDGFILVEPAEKKEGLLVTQDTNEQMKGRCFEGTREVDCYFLRSEAKHFVIEGKDYYLLEKKNVIKDVSNGNQTV